jgi:hypothetical protein
MKAFAVIILGAGLVLAASSEDRTSQSAQAIEGSLVNGTAVANGSDIFQGSQIGNLNLGSSNLDLGNLNVGGENLGQINLDNQQDVVNAIGLMMNALCLGNLFDSNSILSLGSSDDLDLFLELAQLMQLEQLGFLNVIDIASLFNEGSLFGNFDLGVFKRAVDEKKKVG